MRTTLQHYFNHLSFTLFIILGMLGLLAPVSEAASGAFTFSAATYTASEGSGKINLTINRVGGSTGTAAVNFRTNPISATAGNDFVAIPLTTLTFAHREKQKIVSVAVMNDTLVDPNETFQVALSSPTYGTTLGSVNTAVVAIQDDDIITVDITAPAVSLISPASSTTYTSAQTVTIAASASDNIGVSKVELYDGATLLATEVALPHSFAWAVTSANNGSHSLTAKAYDAAGNSKISAATTVTVNIPVPDLTAPAVSLTSPAANTTYTSAQTVTIAASATDNIGVSKVELYDGATLLATEVALPHSFAWAVTSANNGSHSLTAKAYDAAGNSKISAATTVTVNIPVPDLTAPAVSLTSPAANTIYTSAQTVTIAASATDNIGVSKVELYDGATLKGTDTTAPYSFAWAITETDNGSHNFTAKAYDAAGNAASSAAVTVTVNIPVIVPVYTTPALNPVTTSNGNYLLTWSLPASAYGLPAGGYDIFVDGVDDNLHHSTLSALKSGLPLDIEHCFVVEARWTQAVPAVFTASSKVCVPGIQATDVTAPTVSISSPTTGKIFTSAQTVTITAAAADNIGVSKVEFYDGTILTGIATSSPYSISWSISSADNGTHVLSCKAYDNAGNTKTSSSVTIAVDIASAPPSGPLPVFPGAQGFGVETPAGRGGQIIKVTNLNDSGTGSFRAAVQAAGPRIVVFEVSGRIELQSNLVLSNPYITIAGQTAPSPGIQVTGRTFRISTHDVLVQHLRFRVGDEGKSRDGSWDTTDAVQIYGASAYNVVVDHITANWSIDDVFDVTDRAHDISLLDSIIAEPLNNSVHSKGSHGYVSLIAYDVHRVFYARNLLGSGISRLPLFKDSDVGLINNLFYNTSSTEFTASSPLNELPGVVTRASIVNNTYKAGPSGTSRSAIAIGGGMPAGSQLYVSGNTYNAGPIISGGSSFMVNTAPTNTLPPNFVIMQEPQVQSYVLANVGARPADRDAVEKRLTNQVATFTGAIINSQLSVGGFPSYSINTRAFNAGTNPNGDDDGDGYTNVEEILHQMAAAVGG